MAELTATEENLEYHMAYWVEALHGPLPERIVASRQLLLLGQLLAKELFEDARHESFSCVHKTPCSDMTSRNISSSS